MNIEELTLKQIKELSALINCGTTPASPHQPYDIGSNYIVRTVTMIYTGRLIEVGPQELVMTDVSWIPDTERYMEFVAEGKVKECEPYPEGLNVCIGRGAIVDAVPFKKELPRSQK